MFGIGASELLVIFLVALLVLGPEKLPEAARTLAKLFGEFRKATDDLRVGLVGIRDEDLDWRRAHNNPHVIEVQAESVEPGTPVDEKEKEKEKEKEPESVARKSETKNG